MGCHHPEHQAALHDLGCVLAAERAEIRTRRGVHYEPPPGPDPAPPRDDLVGLALSGGGIRSATFSVGLLQGLERLRLLRVFDYLSTVSGGGFAGGWWSAWIARGGLRARTPVELAEELTRRRPALDAGPLGAALRAHQRQPTPEHHQALEAALAVTLDAIAAGAEPPLPPAQGHTFPADEQTDHERARHYVNDRIPDGAMAAGTDPLHHLRLFSNYLTPRKGLLSSDTWRAITVIGRNLMLTWMVLLPILLGAILLGQLYFVWQQFVPRVAVEFIQPAGETAAAVLGRRAAAAASLLLALVAIQAFLAMLWMHYNNDGTPVTQGTALGILVLLVWGGVVMITSPETPPRRCTAFWDCFNRDLWQRYTVWDVTLWVATIVALGVVAGTFLVARVPDGQNRGPSRQLLANTATGRHAFLMSVFVLVSGVLFFSGFAHEAVGALAAHFSLGNLTSVATTLTTVGTVAGALYTALRSAPSANKDTVAGPPGGVGGLVFALTPPLVLLLLATAGAWATHWMLRWMMAPPGTEARLALLTFLVFAGIGLCLVFAAYEAERPDRTRGSERRLTLTGLTAAIGLVAVLITSWVARDFTTLDLRVRVNWLVAAACIAGAASLLWLGWRTMATPSPRGRWALGITGFVILALVVYHAVRLARGGEEIDWAIRTTAIAGVAGLCYAVWLAAGPQGASHVRGPAIALAAVAVGAALAHMTGLHRSGAAFIAPFLVAMVACLVILGYICRRRPATGRRVAMLTFGCLAALICLFLAATHLQGRLELKGEGGKIERRSLDRVTLEYQHRQFRQGQPAAIRSGLLYAATSAVILAAAWAIALGWMADPNALSLHTFYRARLVRSYLGASNWRRHLRHRGIADPTEGDDVLLRRLDTCTYGGPYHLINTTLNLVGGRDLTTAQRSAAAFVLSRGYCGSTRTSYRSTSAYMDGELSLGAAIAASGAAVSPSMGARSPSAALSMLLAFVNVRLGFWAPTPHRVHWRQPQARLWPYYLLWEMFSQTNDLNSYCYLTDGGHFDNTGLYALVERGCRFIVVVDNGADPGPRFADLGDAVRRCRIDFGVEIRLDHLDVLRRSADGAPTSHAAVGTIIYRPPHTTLLGWGDQVREGTIVWIKPAVLASDPADVRQYGLEQTTFPQQSTGDQWFDEAQFESYRRLGEACAEHVFGRAARERLGDGRPLTPAAVEAFFGTVKAGPAPAPRPSAP